MPAKSDIIEANQKRGKPTKYFAVPAEAMEWNYYPGSLSTVRPPHIYWSEIDGGGAEQDCVWEKHPKSINRTNLSTVHSFRNSIESSMAYFVSHSFVHLTQPAFVVHEFS